VDLRIVINQIVVEFDIRAAHRETSNHGVEVGDSTAGQGARTANPAAAAAP